MIGNTLFERAALFGDIPTTLYPVRQQQEPVKPEGSKRKPAQAASFSRQPAATAGSRARPNIVLFLADDLGYGELGCYGNTAAITPNLDRFAAEGLRLIDCHSASSVCSPSRSSLLTGRTPSRNGVFTWIPEGSPIHLRTSEIALPKLLRAAGYDTCHVGKWHLNGMFNSPEQPQPDAHGYDWWLATQNNAAPSHAFPTNFVRNGTAIGKVGDYSAPFIAKEAVMWLREKRDAENPSSSPSGLTNHMTRSRQPSGMRSCMLRSRTPRSVPIGPTSPSSTTPSARS